MKRMRTRTAFYDGRLYSVLIDPVQRRLRRRLAHLVEPGSTVLDAGCGTGALALHLAAKCTRVTGVDLSPRQIGYAEARRWAAGLDHVTFAVADASDLRRWPDGSFDVATIVLALHEMPPEERVPTLRELGRVGRRILAVDYSVPLPGGPAGWLARTIEFLAGPRHFRGFLDFRRHGGLGRLVEEAGLRVESRRTCEGGVLALWELRPVRATDSRDRSASRAT